MKSFYIIDKNGINLKTANTHVSDDINVGLTPNDKQVLIPENIKKDVSILGVTGTYEKPDGYVMPSGKIEITNTEEINVTNYETAQVVDSNLIAENIKEGVSILGKVGTFKGGSSEDATFTEALQPVINEYEEKMKVTYNKTYDTTDNVTIYSPAENAKYYFIQQKSSGVFRIIWSNKPCAYVNDIGELDCLIGMYKYLNTSYVKFDCNKLGETNLTKYINFYSNYSLLNGTKDVFRDVYYSANYNSIEECIEALKSKITYTYASQTSFAGAIYANNTSVILTNGVEVTSNFEINNCGRQLSSNETIVVM